MAPAASCVGWPTHQMLGLTLASQLECASDSPATSYNGPAGLEGALWSWAGTTLSLCHTERMQVCKRKGAQVRFTELGIGPSDATPTP